MKIWIWVGYCWIVWKNIQNDNEEYEKAII